MTGDRPAPPSGDRLTLMLDLDETLIYASDVELDRAADFRAVGYHVYRRPHLQAFLDHVLARYDVGVWTSSGRRYAEAVCAELFPPQALRFLWASERCSLSRDWTTGAYLERKRLQKLKTHGYRLERLVAIDDTPSKHAQNYGNLVCVGEYLGHDPHDDELPRLAAYLDTLAGAANVRTIEKRRWRERIAGNGPGRL